MNLVYNSDVVSETDVHLAPTDRAFQYGDGLFETIRYETGTLWFWSDHHDRLRRGMAALHLDAPPYFTATYLYDTIVDLIQRNGLINVPARIKLQVWRQPGGLYTPTTQAVNWLLTARPGQPFALTEKPRLGIFRDVHLSPSRVSPFKTLNALPYVLAGLYRQQQAVDEVVLLDTAGHLAECVASNLFWIKEGRLFTPSLDTGCIDGIVRRQLLRTHAAQEGRFLPVILDTATTIFCANVSGIQTLLGTPTDPVRPFFDALVSLGTSSANG